MQEHDVSLAGVFDDLVRVETRLYNAVNERLRARHGLFASQFEFLHHLRDHPRSRVGDLATRFAVGVGATSKGIDRLEARGLVRRVPNPEDRRSSLLELTAAGAAVVSDAERTFDEVLEELVGTAVSASRREQLATTLAALRSRLERANAGTPAG